MRISNRSVITISATRKPRPPPPNASRIRRKRKPFPGGLRMKRTIVTVGVGLATALWLAVPPSAQSPAKHGPQLSSFFDFKEPESFEIGLGIIDRFSCVVGALTQPAIYAGNMLVDCDAEVPH